MFTLELTIKPGCLILRFAGVPNDRGPHEANSASWGGNDRGTQEAALAFWGGSERFLLVGVREAIFAQRGEGTALRPWGGRAKGGKPRPFDLRAEGRPPGRPVLV